MGHGSRGDTVGKEWPNAIHYTTAMDKLPKCQLRVQTLVADQEGDTSPEAKSLGLRRLPSSVLVDGD